MQIGLLPRTMCEDSDCSDSLQVSIAQHQGHPIKTSGCDQHLDGLGEARRTVSAVIGIHHHRLIVVVVIMIALI